MKCPFCRSDSRVIDTRDIADQGIRRRRMCIKCGNRFTTFETVKLEQREETTLPIPDHQPVAISRLTPVQQARFNLIKEKLRARQEKTRATG